MKTRFDEFRYGDGDWKVERFAIIKYPNWCHDVREPGRLTCMSGISCSHCRESPLLLGARQDGLYFVMQEIQLAPIKGLQCKLLILLYTPDNFWLNQMI